VNVAVQLSRVAPSTDSSVVSDAICSHVALYAAARVRCTAGIPRVRAFLTSVTDDGFVRPS
jgi:hypothetical protein